MKVRFEQMIEGKSRLVNEVSFPHAELPLGDTVLLVVDGYRRRFGVGGIEMLAEGGELKAVVCVVPLPDADAS
jgi:hypothetical protein